MKIQKSKPQQKFRFLHAAIITLGLFLINQPSKPFQDNFQQIALTISQALTTYLMME